MDYPLPFEMYLHIASFCPRTWKAMLAVPQFGRATLCKEIQSIANRCFTVKATEGDKITFSRLGKLNSVGDNPALVFGTRREWYSDGKLHRDDDLPAVIDVDLMEWWEKGVLLYSNHDISHKVRLDGTRVWCSGGKIHRDGDKPAIFGDNFREWWKNGKRHRKDKPAVISGDGKKEWWNHGIKLDGN